MSKSRHSRTTRDDEQRQRRPRKPPSARSEIDEQLTQLADLFVRTELAGGAPVLVYGARIRHYDIDGRDRPASADAVALRDAPTSRR